MNGTGKYRSLYSLDLVKKSRVLGPRFLHDIDTSNNSRILYPKFKIK